MKITRCTHGHYFDADKFKACPICAQGAAAKAEHEQKTAALFYKDGPSGNAHHSTGGARQDRLTERYFETHKTGGRTIGIYRTRDVNPVAGWLVCRNGKSKGRFYAIYTGINTIGTAHSADIVLCSDKMCPEDHACIVFDDRNTAFYIQPKNGSVCVNGAPITGQQRLKTNDVLTLDDLTLDFIAYCTENRNWNNCHEENKNEKD